MTLLTQKDGALTREGSTAFAEPAARHSGPRRWRLRLFSSVGAVLAVCALSGCSAIVSALDSQPQAPQETAEQSAGSAPEAADGASTHGGSVSAGAQDSPQPSLNIDEGAAEAATVFVDTMFDGFQSTDSAPLRALYEPQCGNCEETADGIDEQARTGSVLTIASIIADEPLELEATGDIRTFLINAELKDVRMTVNGVETSSVSLRQSAFVISVTYTEQGWRVVGFEHGTWGVYDPESS